MRQGAVGQQGDVHPRHVTPIGRLDQQVQSLALECGGAVRVLHEDEEGLGSLLPDQLAAQPLARPEHGTEPDEIVGIDSRLLLRPEHRVTVRSRPTRVLISLETHQNFRRQERVHGSKLWSLGRGVNVLQKGDLLQ